MKLNRVHVAVMAALTGVGGLSVQTVSAQEGSGGLEEIVVTATRRAENLQEVPISIVAVTGENLEMRGLQNVENLNATIPNLSVMGSAGGAGTSATSFRVRGIPGVGTYVDGIYQVSTTGLLNEEFSDLDRLEVLRGPQGTLFGRESIGGAVRIFTKRPTDEFGGTFKGTIGSLNRRDATIIANLPFSDNVKSKWTFANLNRDGYVRSLTTNLKGGNIDQSSARGDIVWTPTEKLDIRGQMSRQTDSFIEPRVADAVWLGAAWFPTTAGLLYNYAGLPYNQVDQMSGWPGGTVGKWENRSEITIPNKVTKDQASLDVKLAMTDKLSIDFLTGYTDLTSKVYVDYDNSQWGLVEDTTNAHTHLISEEIQVSGGGDRVKWVAGAFFWDTWTRTRGVSYSFEEFNINPLGVGGLPVWNANNNNANALRLLATQFCADQRAANPAVPGVTPGYLAPPFPAPVNCETALAYYKSAYNLGNSSGRGGNLSDSANTGLALFGEVTFSLTQKFDLAVGLRNHDQHNNVQTMLPRVTAPAYVNREFSGDPLSGDNNAAPRLLSFEKATGRVSAKYQFTNEIMGYMSYSTGFNPGGTSNVAVPGAGTKLFDFGPEDITNTEFGIRSDLANKHIRLNATVFDTKWNNMIVNLALQTCLNNVCVDSRSVAPYNVANAHARGVEIEMIIAPTSNLLFNVNLGYLDTGFDKILLTQTASGGTAAGLGYVAGQTEFSQAPQHTINVGVQHDARLKGGGSLTTRFDYSYVSQYWRAADPRLRVAWYANNGSGIFPGYSDESGDFGQFNARLTYAPANSKWDVALFGTNLTNQYQLNSGFFHGIWGYDFATVARPREVGTSITFHF